MPKVPFEPTEIEDVVETTGTDITAYDTDAVATEEMGAIGATHQPVLIAIDASGSMTQDAGNGKSKLQTCVDLLNDLPNNPEMTRLSALEKDAVDMAVLSFAGDDVMVHSPWQPLTIFEGVSSIQSGTTTPLYKTIAKSIQFTRVYRQDVAQRLGTSVYRPQIFIYTDGLATDPENRDEAKQLCTKYLEKHGDTGPKAKVFVILVPGSMSDAEIKKITADMEDLSKEIIVILAKDCVNGLPATFNFLASSVVVGVSSAVGTELQAEYDSMFMGVHKNHVAKAGVVNLDTQEIGEQSPFV